VFFGISEAIKKAVESGLGVCCLSSMANQGELDNGWLVEIANPHDLKRTLIMVYQKSAHSLLIFMDNIRNWMKIKHNLIIVAIIALVVIGNFSLVPLHSYASEYPAEVKIEKWADNHPKAASDLLEWMGTHKEGAREIIQWECRHPGRIRTFVIWVITHVGKKYDIFGSSAEFVGRECAEWWLWW
jgi:hypothetical protein